MYLPNSEDLPRIRDSHKHTSHHTLARNLTRSLPQPDAAGRLLTLPRTVLSCVVQWGGTLASPVVTVINSSCLPHALRVALGCRADVRCLLYFPSLPVWMSMPSAMAALQGCAGLPQGRERRAKIAEACKKPWRRRRGFHPP